MNNKTSELLDMEKKIVNEMGKKDLIKSKVEYYSKEIELYRWFEKALCNFQWCDDCLSEEEKLLNCRCQEQYFHHCSKVRNKFEQKQKRVEQMQKDIKEKEE